MFYYALEGRLVLRHAVEPAAQPDPAGARPGPVPPLAARRHRPRALALPLATIALACCPSPAIIMLPLEERFPPFRDDGSARRRHHPARRRGRGGGFRRPRHDRRQRIRRARARHDRSWPTAIRTPASSISGGGGTVFGDGTAEAPIIAAYLKSIGIDPARILVEDRSRTTSENAAYSRGPSPSRRPASAGFS